MHVIIDVEKPQRIWRAFLKAPEDQLLGSKYFSYPFSSDYWLFFIQTNSVCLLISENLKRVCFQNCPKLNFCIEFCECNRLKFSGVKSLWEFEKHMPGLQNCSQLKDRHLQFPQTLHSLSWLRYWWAAVSAAWVLGFYPVKST